MGRLAAKDWRHVLWNELLLDRLGHLGTVVLLREELQRPRGNDRHEHHARRNGERERVELRGARINDRSGKHPDPGGQ